MLKVVSNNSSIDIMEMLRETGAILEGHFKLTSGYHSQYYLQCAKLLRYPRLTSKLAEEAKNMIAKSVDLDQIDTVISPAMGGILFGYMMAYHMDREMIFTERKSEKMELRRGFSLKEGQRVIIAEDVVTTGGSVKEVIEICQERKAKILTVTSIVDRSQKVDFGVPYYPLISLSIENFLPQDCPLCREGVKIDAPGSRV